MVKHIIFLFLIVSVNVMATEQLLVDPTQPLEYKAHTLIKKKQRARVPALPKLQSILIKGSLQQAIMNNKLYTTGQRVNGYTITQIENNVVLLSYKSKSYKLTLYTNKENVIR